MTAKEIFFKTLQFGWIKLGLGLLNILIAVLLFAILMGISVLFNSDGGRDRDGVSIRLCTCQTLRDGKDDGKGTFRYIQRVFCLG